MRRRASLILCAVVLSGPRLDAQPDAGQVGKWVGELASPDFKVRQSAFDHLARCGEEAVEPLRKAAERKDPEVRQRARMLLARIERKLDFEKVLTPTRINLDYRDAPLNEVVNDLARRTNFPFVLQDVDQAGKERITLQARDVPVLEALARFYARAGLAPPWVEPSAEVNFEYRRNSSSVIITTRRDDPDPTDLLNRYVEGSTVVLRRLPEGSPTPVVSHAGAVQLGLVARARTGAEEVRIEVEAMTEPHLVWERSHGVRVDRATDEKGRALVQVVEDVQRKSEQQFSRRGVVIVNRQVFGETETSAEQKNPLIILKINEESKCIARLEGVVIAQVRTRPEDVVAIDGVLNLKQKQFPGRFAAGVFVNEVEESRDGSVRLLLGVTEPPRDLEDPRKLGREVTVIVDGKVVNGPRVPTLGRENFRLLDEAGRPWELASAYHTGNTDGRTCEIELVFTPPARGAAAARFVYRDRPSRIVEVPFRFEDVAVPEYRAEGDR